VVEGVKATGAASRFMMSRGGDGGAARGALLTGGGTGGAKTVAGVRRGLKLVKVIGCPLW
jgi:hypothetical protein